MNIEKEIKCLKIKFLWKIDYGDFDNFFKENKIHCKGYYVHSESQMCA